MSRQKKNKLKSNQLNNNKQLNNDRNKIFFY